MKRYLYLWHRWLGIGLCLLLALWFFSGVVMLYVGYPKLTPAEHLARLPALQVQDCCVDLGTALLAAPHEQAPSSIRLSSVAGRPHYLLGYRAGESVAVDARSGQRVYSTLGSLMASAEQFDPAPAVYLGSVWEDAWSHSRALDSERPLHRIQLQDRDASLLYLSGQTGAVVRVATGNERLWNWVGAWLHWLYPLRGGVLDGAWGWVVTSLAFAASLMCLSGMLVGVLRWRFTKPYRSGSRTPYKGIARWHHLLGLVFGSLALTWVFSGWLSMNPWRVFEHPQALASAAYQGGPLIAEAFATDTTEALARFTAEGFIPREIEWRRIGGQGYLLARDGTGAVRLLDGDGRVHQSLEPEALVRAAAAMWPAGTPQVETLHAYDAYYYGRAEHSMLGHLDKPLPALRLRFDDPAATWLHLDPRSGALIEQLDERRRVYRWLFNLLHSWDWLPLLERPPLWQGLLITLSVGGSLLSLSATWLGWRRLRPRKPLARRLAAKRK
ncbi:PepSY domain-containing protein [Pseudomonas sp. MF4836]|uniref:PepSY domain-containing protein n=1 Tax=Pseudomonas sp. MF4836 TaxID=1960827 RepID=UPI000996DD97|nr:PepSY domain-containing protein [Pseudomonas sp. MF4836]